MVPHRYGLPSLGKKWNDVRYPPTIHQTPRPQTHRITRTSHTQLPNSRRATTAGGPPNHAHQPHPPRRRHGPPGPGAGDAGGGPRAPQRLPPRGQERERGSVGLGRVDAAGASGAVQPGAWSGVCASTPAPQAAPTDRSAPTPHGDRSNLPTPQPHHNRHTSPPSSSACPESSWMFGTPAAWAFCTGQPSATTTRS